MQFVFVCFDVSYSKKMIGIFQVLLMDMANTDHVPFPKCYKLVVNAYINVLATAYSTPENNILIRNISTIVENIVVYDLTCYNMYRQINANNVGIFAAHVNNL